MNATKSLATVKAEVEAEGFAVIPRLIAQDDVDRVLAALESSRLSVRRSGGVRNLAARVPAIAELADSAPLRAVVEEVLDPAARVVRSILFDKHPAANWNLGWHQDVTIAVSHRAAVDGYGPWTKKAGVVSVQSPVAILERMITVRVHLDPCGADNGPLRVIPRSHSEGRLSTDEMQRWVRNSDEVVCATSAGGALVMRPLLLHASAPAASPSHRRVVHMDYAVGGLDGGLRWSSAA